MHFWCVGELVVISQYILSNLRGKESELMVEGRGMVVFEMFRRRENVGFDGGLGCMDCARTAG